MASQEVKAFQVRNIFSRAPGDIPWLAMSYTLPFLVVLFTVTLVGAADGYFVYMAVRQHSTAWRVVLGVVFVIAVTASGGMLLWSFFRVTLTNPGHVPSEPWSRPPGYAGKAYSDNPYEVTTLGRDGKLRFCHPCRQYKPDGAHHCPLCRHCVYRMDHHCPWINNCVGRDNTKFFVQFLMYFGICGVVTGALMLVTLFAIDTGPRALRDEHRLIWTICPGMGLAMGGVVGCFGLSHVYLIARGESTMSRFIDGRRAEEVKRVQNGGRSSPPWAERRVPPADEQRGPQYGGSAQPPHWGAVGAPGTDPLVGVSGAVEQPLLVPVPAAMNGKCREQLLGEELQGHSTEAGQPAGHVSGSPLPLGQSSSIIIGEPPAPFPPTSPESATQRRRQAWHDVLGDDLTWWRLLLPVDVVRHDPEVF